MKKPSLQEEISQFQKDKKRLIPGLLMLGIVGLVLPIIPGVALLSIGVSLLSPGHGGAILKRLHDKFSI